jgi:gamma-glutamyltranspeptidase/glutathione hydrolase
LISQKINLETHTPSTQIQTTGNPVEVNQDGNTTNFSVADKDGNMVANTYTLNYFYGNGKTVPGTGILLNNEMDDFTSKVGVANSFGLMQGETNAIAPEKRPLSSMTPSIVLNKKNEPFLAIGTPGGSRIITQLLLLLIGVIDYNKNIQTAVSVPRFHSQLWPDKFYYEDGISPETLDALKKMGHNLEKVNPYGSTQTVEIKNENTYLGSSDPRSEGDGAVGY